MALTDLLGSALRTAALGLSLYISGCGGGPASDGCQTDYDCRAPRVCEQSRCVNPNEGEAEGEGDLQRSNNNPTKNGDNSLQNLIGKIVFISIRDTHDENNYEIYSINADGNNLRRLTNNLFEDREPRWSPDGTKIAFVSYRDLPNHEEIYTMDADGTNVRRLTQTGEFVANNNPSWSPDGRRIAFVSGSEYADIYGMDTEGSNMHNLTNTPPGVNNYFPSWSPDGTKITFASNRNAGYLELYTMNADGSNPTRLTYNGSEGYESEYPAWFPGLQILFSYVGDIYLMNDDGSGVQRITFSGNCINPCWSPDGTEIAYTFGNDYLIKITTADGTQMKELTEGTQPSWAP